jgi:transcriptional regulator GlxA family with amidase domain
MQRKHLLIGIATAACALGATSLAANASPQPLRGKPLHPPAHGPVNVAFVLGPNLVAIDLFGPAAAFGDGNFDGMNMVQRFNIYTVAANTKPVDIGLGTMQAAYAFDDAPQPQVLVVPMQDSLPETIAYIKKAAVHADVTMSICTGAFLVAQAGLFDGGRATTHHAAYDAFAKRFPNVELVREVRYVEDRNVSSSGGESSGIDLGLRVIERYYGRQAADVAAYNMEYRRTLRPTGVGDV